MCGLCGSNCGDTCCDCPPACCLPRPLDNFSPDVSADESKNNSGIDNKSDSHSSNPVTAPQSLNMNRGGDQKLSMVAPTPSAVNNGSNNPSTAIAAPKSNSSDSGDLNSKSLAAPPPVKRDMDEASISSQSTTSGMSNLAPSNLPSVAQQFSGSNVASQNTNADDKVDPPSVHTSISDRPDSQAHGSPSNSDLPTDRAPKPGTMSSNSSLPTSGRRPSADIHIPVPLPNNISVLAAAALRLAEMQDTKSPVTSAREPSTIRRDVENAEAAAATALFGGLPNTVPATTPTTITITPINDASAVSGSNLQPTVQPPRYG